MPDKNIWDPNPPLREDEPENSDKSVNSMRIVGINLLILAVYTIISGFIKDVGPFLDALFLGIHIIVCIIIAAVTGKMKWILSAFVVLLVGLSTCVGILWKLV